MDENTDLQTLEQQKAIQKDINDSQRLISEHLAINGLMDMYTDATLPGFVPGVKYLDETFSTMRKLYEQGDDTSIESAKSESDRVLSIAKNSMSELVATGYNEFAIETFYDEFVEVLEGLFDHTSDSLLALFRAEGGSAEYFTWFMRLLTAGYIKRDPERFTPFLSGNYFDVESFCRAEVEPMGRECEQIQIIALSEYLGVSVHIAYLDGRLFNEADGLPSVIFPDPSSSLQLADDRFAVQLLYRPGHYDILYK